MQVSTQGTARVSRRRTRAVFCLVEVTPGSDVDDRATMSRIRFRVAP